jgi:hypothetical protein
MTDKRYAELFWTPPQDCTSIKGSITGYTVKLMGLGPWVSTTQPLPAVQKRKGKHFARCENLMPYTQFELTAQCCNICSTVFSILPTECFFFCYYSVII